jgi:hypothetical protein
MPAKKTHGGARPGSGAKPKPEKRVPKTAYLKPSIVAKIPGSLGKWIESDPRLK